MKELKVSIIAMIIACAIIISCACACPANAEEYGEFYPRLTVVFQIENTNDFRIVYCTDKSQNTWVFFDHEFQYESGDIANLLMWNNNPDITKHEIIEVYWEGYTENLDLFFEMDGWR